MVARYFVQILFAAAGILSFLAAVCNWEWFFTSRNTQSLIRSIGRTKSRLFYGILGIILIGTAIFFFFQPENP